MRLLIAHDVRARVPMPLPKGVGKDIARLATLRPDWDFHTCSSGTAHHKKKWSATMKKKIAD